MHEDANISDKFVIEHLNDLSVLHNTFRRRLDHFLKSTFTDKMDHDHIDKILSEKEMYGILVCGYQINAEDLDIFSCIIFKYLDPDNYDASTKIVYIASSHMFHGLKLALLMLCILSSLLLFQCYSCILFASTSPINEDWYMSQQFQYVDPDNKFDIEEFLIDKEFVSKVFQNCICHSYLDKESGLQYDKDGN